MGSTEEELRPLAIAVAAVYGIDAALVQSVCCHESSWNPEATRYEPAFFERYIKPMVTPDGLIKGYPSTLEAQLRSTSIGLMQVMGQTAREQGFTLDLEALKQPHEGLMQGCTKLARCLKVKGNVESALEMYNGGSDPKYASMVLQFYDKYKSA